MARRRLNTKVLAAVLIGAVVAIIAGFAANRFLNPNNKSAAALEADGDKFFADGEYERAKLAYGGADAKDRANPALKVKLGDTLIKLTRDDQANLGLALGTWESALQIDQRYKPALERLLGSLWEQLELMGGDANTEPVYTRIRRRSEQLANADPDHKKAFIWRYTATLRQALGSQAVQKDELETSIEALKKLASEDPTASEPPYYLAVYKTKQARDLIAAKSNVEARLAAEEAFDIMDKALQGQDTNAQMQFRGAILFAELKAVHPRAADLKLVERASKCIYAAAANIKPGEENYDQIMLGAADQMNRDGKPNEARETVRKYYESNPQNQQARLAWARVLASKIEDRAKAIEILAQDIPLPKDVVGVGVFKHRFHQALTLEELIRLRTSDAAATTDPEKKKAHFALVDADMERLRRLTMPKAPRLLALEGQLLLVKGKAIEAVKVMEEAHAIPVANPRDRDWEMIYRLARTYYTEVNQLGRARQLCEEIVQGGFASPSIILASRATLAELLVRENNVPAAAQQVEIIRAQTPDFPDLGRLETMLAFAQGANNPANLESALKKMPETANPERWNKVLVAQRINNQNEQIRLLTDILKNEPGDVNAVRTLANLYRSRQMVDRAKQVVAEGLKAKPDDASLRIFNEELGGATAADLRKSLREEIDRTITDPYAKSMRLYELENMAGGDPEQALAHLRKCIELRPNDLRALDILYKEILERRDFAEANKLLPKLVELNGDQVGGQLYKHRLAIVQQNYAEAERTGLALVTEWPEFAQSWFALGQAQEALGKWPEAIRSLTEVLARQPMHYEATRALVDTYYNSGRTDDAKARLKQMRLNFPNDPTVRELYLNHLANFGEPQAAIPEREELLKKTPEESWPYLALAATYFKNAQKLSAENKLEDSRKELDKAFEKLSQGQRKFPDDVRFYAQVAEMQQYNGHLEQAEKVLQDFARRENMKQAPAKIRPDPWLALAEYYGRVGQPAKVAQALAEALVRSDNNLDVRLRLVSAQIQARQFSDARSTLDAVRNSLDPRVSRQSLELLIAEGKLADAENEIRRTLKLRDGADLRNLLGSVLIDTRRPADAIAELNQALKLDPKNESARYLRAMAHARKSPPDLDTAINELVDLKRSAPRLMQARLLLAELYDKTGRRGNAMQDLIEAVAAAPGNREVRLALIRLYRAERPPRIAEAMDLIRQAGNDPVLKSDPAWPREAAMLFMQQRNVQQAVMMMNRAVQLSPGNIEYRRELIDMLLQFNDLAGASIQIDKLLAEQVDGWWLRFQRALTLGRQINRKMIADAAKDPKIAAKMAELKAQALEEFDQAIKMSEGEGDEERLVSILRSLGETVGNDQALLRVGPRMARDPTNRWKLLSVGLKRAQGDFAGAVADAERMLADPSNGVNDPERRGPILRALADTYQNQPTPDYAKARARYDELLRLVPDDLASLNNAAYLIAENLTPPDPQAAKAYSERAYEITRTSSNPNAMIMDTHGWVLVRCGGSDLEKGKRILQNIVEQNPMFVEGRYHLGEALLLTNPPAPAQAEKEFTECLRLMDEEEKIGGKIDQKLRKRVETGLANARLAKNG